MGSQNREIDNHEDCNAPVTKHIRSVQRNIKAQSDFSQFRKNKYIHKQFENILDYISKWA